MADYAAQWPSYGALKDAMSYSLLSGGKRIRPALTLAVCRLSGAEDRVNVVASAALLERCPLTEGEELSVEGEVRSFNNRSGVGSRW